MPMAGLSTSASRSAVQRSRGQIWSGGGRTARDGGRSEELSLASLAAFESAAKPLPPTPSPLWGGVGEGLVIGSSGPAGIVMPGGSAKQTDHDPRRMPRARQRAFRMIIPHSLLLLLLGLGQ